MRKALRSAFAPALAACLLLPACMGGGEFATRGLLSPRAAPETLAVAGRDVVIGGPPGYCIDRAASRDMGDSAFVLLGSCASILQDARAAAPGLPGLLTASVAEPLPEGEGLSSLDPDRLEAFFTSERGRAALARDGRASSVAVLETRARGDAFFIRLEDTSADSTPGLAPDYWRGLADLNGHLVTVTAQAFADRRWSADAGFETIIAFLDRTRRETARTAPAAEPARGPLAGLFAGLRQ